MALNKVSQVVLDAVYDRLSDGFNDGIISQAPNYGLETNFIQLDWSEQSKNFFFAQLDTELLEKSGIFKYPCACLYTLDSGQTGEQRFNQFSGEIRCVFDMFLSWKQTRGKHNHEAYGNCIEDVVFDVINRVENQNWGKPLVYNGNIRCRRGPLNFGAENFKQRIAFAMVFGLHQ